MGISQGMGSAALLPAGFGFRNLIINGDMRINQRGFIATVDYGVIRFVYDRWGAYYNAINVMEYQTSTDTPNGTLFAGSIKCAVSGSSGGFSDFSEAYIQQKIEGHNCRPLSWGSSEAKSAVLSFWVKSNVIGTYSVSFLNGAEDRVYVATYTVNSSNTWEQKLITVPGDVGGSWTYTNTAGVNVRFNLDSTPSQSGSANVWRATAGAPSTTQTSIMDTDGAEFLLTGVQFEQNYQATPFEHRPISVELQLCQRYYWRVTGVAGAYKRTNSGGVVYSGNSWTGQVYNPVVMRRIPTSIEFSGISTTDSISWDGTSFTSVTLNEALSTPYLTYVSCSGGTGFGNNPTGAPLILRGEASAFFASSAEL